MIIVHGVFPLKAETRKEALKLMREMAFRCRAEEGCISYEFYVGLSDPNTLLLFQEWESAEALQDHFESDHIEEFHRVILEVLDGEVATRRYVVRVDSDTSDPSDLDPESQFEPRFQQREKIIH